MVATETGGSSGMMVADYLLDATILRGLIMNSRTKAVAREPLGEPLETESNFVKVELIEDPVTIAECWFKIRSDGGLLVCHRCGDVDSWVVAILAMSDDPEECYALCGKCLRDLPEEIDEA
jgi:hypothetical protein